MIHSERITAWSQFKSGMLALVLAALVWVFAEGESLSSRTINILVNFPTDVNSEMFIRPEDPNFRGTIRVRLEGTLRTLDQAVSRVGSTVNLGAGTPGLPTITGRQYVDLREAISGIPELKGLGSTVAEVEPRTIAVQATRMVQRELPIRVELQGDVPLDGEPTTSVEKAIVRLCESAVERLPQSVTAVVGEMELRRIRGDGLQTVTATLRTPLGLNGSGSGGSGSGGSAGGGSGGIGGGIGGGMGGGMGGPVVVSPETVNVTLRVKRRSESLKIPTVPVWFSLPPTEDTSRWIISIEDKFLSDVTLTGPADELQRIRTGQLSIKAMVELTSDELERGITSKAATFPSLPAGVVPTSASQSVRVKITRREP